VVRGGRGELAPWFDSRRDLDQRFIEGFAPNAGTIGQADPVSRQASTPVSMHPWRRGPAGPHAQALGHQPVHRLLRRRADGLSALRLAVGERSAKLHRLHVAFAPGEDRITREAFDAVRNGAKQIGWFAPLCSESPPQGRFSYLAADLTPDAKGRAIAAANAKLLAGPARSELSPRRTPTGY